MVDGITAGGASPGVKPAAPASVVGPARTAAAPQAQDATIPDAPPPEVIADVHQAAQALTEMARKQLALGLSVDGSNRLRVQIRDGHGRLVREIPASKAIDLLTGADGALVENYG